MAAMLRDIAVRRTLHEAAGVRAATLSEWLYHRNFSQKLNAAFQVNLIRPLVNSSVATTTTTTISTRTSTIISFFGLTTRSTITASPFTTPVAAAR